MANEDDKIGAVFDLDTKESLEKILELKGGIESLGDAKNTEGLLEGLTKVGGAVAAIGVAAFALKTTFDTVFEAENIKQINNQFELLTRNSGLATDTLKAGLIEAAHGLVDDTDLMRAANRAIVEMGSSAEKLPELMDLARKSTAVFGGDAITRFEELNQAIASGSQRALKHMGIMVDVDRAYRDYAASIGVASGELNDAGKRQALLNAVLIKGQDAFKGVDENIKEATNTWQQLKVTLSEVKEVFVLAFDKVMGPSVTGWLKSLQGWAGHFKDIFQAKFGEGVDAAVAKSKLLSTEIMDLQGQLIDVDQAGQVFFNGTYVKKGSAEYELAVKKMQDRLAALQGQMKSASDTIEEHEQKAKTLQAQTSTGGSGDDGKVDRQKKLADEARFQHEMLKIQEDRIRDSMKLTKSLSEFEALNAQQKENLTLETEAKIKALQQNEHLNATQKNQMIAAEEAALHDKLRVMDEEAFEHKRQMMQGQIALQDNLDQYEEIKRQEKETLRQQYELQLQQIEQTKFDTEQQRANAKLEAERNYQLQLYQIQDQAEREREQITTRWVQHGNNAAEQWARGFASGSLKAQQNLRNFGEQGSKVFDVFTSHASNAFMELGEGSKKGSDIMRTAMLGMIADVAQYYGQMMLAAGIFPPNPPVLAAGAGLLVLAGYLRGQAKGKGESMSVSTATGASGMGEIGGVPSSLTQGSLVDQNQKQAKMVHLEIHGSVFDSDSTRTRIADIVRQSEDATDFGITRIGGGV